MNASGHNGLDKWSDVLVLDGPLPSKLIVGEPGPVCAKGHRLVLKVTLSTLRGQIVKVLRRFVEEVPPGHRLGSQVGG